MTTPGRSKTRRGATTSAMSHHESSSQCKPSGQMVVFVSCSTCPAGANVRESCQLSILLSSSVFFIILPPRGFNSSTASDLAAVCHPAVVPPDVLGSFSSPRKTARKGRSLNQGRTCCRVWTRSSGHFSPSPTSSRLSRMWAKFGSFGRACRGRALAHVNRDVLTHPGANSPTCTSQSSPTTSRLFLI